MTLQEAIAEHRKKKLAESGDINILIAQAIAEIKPEIVLEVQRKVLRWLETTKSEYKKGDKGEDGNDGNDGADGNDYILTEEDKKEIASLIDVPIVEKIIEKTEVIKENPIITEITKVTNEIKEVAITDTPQKIADKINTLEEKIEQTTIKGLSSFLQNLQRAIREKAKGGGGGMGNIQYEEFNLTTGTANIQTAYPIAQGGRAIIQIIADQAELRRTVHYTVGSDKRIVTFNDEIRRDFVENGKLFIVYIRG